MGPYPSQGTVLAEEIHTGRFWAVIILLATVAAIISVAQHPPATAPARVVLGGAAILCLGGFAMSWVGFQYRFLSDALEIRTLGLRLRSIPKSAILSYAVEPWTFIQGYGIRGLGSRRAYVWCNNVVHIHTSSGDVYLGHNEPERILRDLDQMMGVVSQG